MFFTTLRAQRITCHFTQDEIAFLLGGMCGTKICRYEQGRRTPSLKTALALQIIYGVPVNMLFPDLYEDMHTQITRRARMLLKASQDNAYKQQVLEAIIATSG